MSIISTLKMIKDFHLHVNKIWILEDQAAESVAGALINKFVTIFASPETIVTDRGSQFCSALIKGNSIMVQN